MFNNFIVAWVAWHFSLIMHIIIFVKSKLILKHYKMLSDSPLLMVTQVKSANYYGAIYTKYPRPYFNEYILGQMVGINGARNKCICFFIVPTHLLATQRFPQWAVSLPTDLRYFTCNK